jgi:hypothetical protein
VAIKAEYAYCPNCGIKYFPVGPQKLVVTGELRITPKTTAKKKPAKKQ